MDSSREGFPARSKFMMAPSWLARGSLGGHDAWRLTIIADLCLNVILCLQPPIVEG